MKNKGHIHIPLFMLGLFLILTAAACIAGHFIPEPWLCCWRGDIGMAFNTALCFGAIGIGFIIISFWRREIENLTREDT